MSGCYNKNRLRKKKKAKKMFSFSLIERVILSAGAMLIFSVCNGTVSDSNSRPLEVAGEKPIVGTYIVIN